MKKNENEMYVIKRSGKREVISFDKILKRLRSVGRQQNLRNIMYAQITMKVIDQLKDNEWDMLYFSGRHDNPTIMYNDNLMRLTGSLGAFAYAINKTLIRILYVSLIKNGCEVDTYYKEAIHPRFRCYSVYPHIVTCDPNTSNIYGTYLDYSNKIDNIPII